MKTKLFEYKFKLLEPEDSEFSFHSLFNDHIQYEQKIINSKMSTKLFTYKIKLFEHEDSEFSFSALADNEYEAQTLILQKTENELYKTELKKKFNDSRFKPIVFEKNDVFIQHNKPLKLFSH